MARLFNYLNADRIEWDIPVFQQTAGVTIALWLYSSAPTADNQRSIHIANSLNEFRLTSQVNDINAVQFSFQSTGNVTYGTTPAGIVDFNSTLYHIIHTHQGTSQSADIQTHVNGLLIDLPSGFNGTPPLLDSLSRITAGERPVANDFRWNGMLAEISIWTRPLTTPEVAQLAGGDSALFIPNGLVFYATLNQSRQDAVDEVSGVPGIITGTSVTTHPPIVYPSQSGLVSSRGFANMDRNFINMRG